MNRPQVLFAAALASCALMLAQGCASTEKTTTVSTTSSVGSAPVSSQAATGDVEGNSSSANPAPPPTTTTTTTTQSNEPDSVLGATLHLVGTVILLPFRIVGDVLGALV